MKRDKGQKFHDTNVSSDPGRSYEQDCVWQGISKGKWCWESTANSESGDFSSAAALGRYFSQVQWAPGFQLGCVRHSPRLLPWPVELWLLPAAESFIPGSCPNNDVQNNILPNLPAPSIWRGKSLRFPTEKVCKGLNSAFCQTERYSSDKLFLGWETDISSTINIICSPSFLTFKNRTHTCYRMIISPLF